MTLTPEQWKALDEAERAFAESTRAVAERGVPFAGQGNGLDQEHFNRWSDLEQLLVFNARALIDAARPKCSRCDGHGAVRAYGPIDDHAACPDCRGTGCAA